MLYLTPTARLNRLLNRFDDLTGIATQATGVKITTQGHSGIWSGYMVIELVVRSWFGYRVV